MKGRAAYLVIFLCLSLLSFSQGKREKIEALRVAFISKETGLTSNEAEKFWPVYNEYNDKIKEIRRTVRLAYRSKGENPSEKEAEDIFALEYKSRQAEADVHRLYSERIRTLIGAVKYTRLRKAEEEFRRKIIDAID